jgi:hypothetical protein
MCRLLPCLVLLVLPLVAGACARGEPLAYRDQSVLTEEQLRESGYANLYDAVDALRPRWLRPRGPDSFSSPTQVVVYSDGVRLGGVEELRGFGTLQILWVRYYDGLEASARWGLGHGQGVIHISSRPRGDSHPW